MFDALLIACFHFLIQQEVEYVKQEAKIVYLLECLQKTTPPVCTSFSSHLHSTSLIIPYVSFQIKT